MPDEIRQLEVPPSGTRGTKMRGTGFLRVFSNAFVGLYRLSGGRLGGRAGLLLTTVGARSGESRTVPLGAFPDGEGRWLVVASLAGAARHPAWLHNLARHPDQVWVEFGKERVKVRPEILRGEQRAVAWERIVTVAPGYGRYVPKTDREMPVVRLTRER
jgi:deazaflavin-dependent oxidoreductase (nitroreductase family)